MRREFFPRFFSLRLPGETSGRHNLGVGGWGSSWTRTKGFQGMDVGRPQVPLEEESGIPGGRSEGFVLISARRTAVCRNSTPVDLSITDSEMMLSGTQQLACSR